MLDRAAPKAHKSVFTHFSNFKNVQMYFGEKVDKIVGNTLYTTKGSEIKTNVIISCVGFSPNTKMLQDDLSQFVDEKSKLIKVNDYLQVGDFKNVFAGGKT